MLTNEQATAAVKNVRRVLTAHGVKCRTYQKVSDDGTKRLLQFYSLGRATHAVVRSLKGADIPHEHTQTRKADTVHLTVPPDFDHTTIPRR